MVLTNPILRQLDNPALSRNERALLRCRVAADFEQSGQYEAACAALYELWQGIGQRPAIAGLGELAAAEVLLRAGALSGWLGSSRQAKGAQGAAKDLISESVARFQALGESVRVAAAQSELGYCYWRAGSFDEARIIYTTALEKLKDQDTELQAKISIRLAIVEVSTGRYDDALRILTAIAPLLETSRNHALRGKFHHQLGCALTCLVKAERRMDYIDNAILEYTAAAYYFEEAGHTRYCARAENNVGFLLYTLHRHNQAHQHLNYARRLFAALKDTGSIAQVDETRARVFLAEGRSKDAERVIGDAVLTLAQGDEQGLLAEALTTQGQVLARAGKFAESRLALCRAADIAELAGAVEDAGRALLALIAEHAPRLTAEELFAAYLRADNLLKETQDAETVARLRACARRILSERSAASPDETRDQNMADSWVDFSLDARVRAFEARYIRQALIDAEGSISHAARLLGFSHHGSLASLLKGKHRDLAHLRTPAIKRRRSLLRSGHRRRRRKPAHQVAESARPITILCVEDNSLVAHTVSDALKLEGWQVELCSGVETAIRQLESETRYDLLIFANETASAQGIELIARARALPHRQQTPIIMLAGSDCEARARRAGANAFLPRPEGMTELAAIAARLLGIEPAKG